MVHPVFTTNYLVHSDACSLNPTFKMWTTWLYECSQGSSSRLLRIDEFSGKDEFSQYAMLFHIISYEKAFVYLYSIHQ